MFESLVVVAISSAANYFLLNLPRNKKEGNHQNPVPGLKLPC